MSSIEKINMCLEELNVGMSRYNQEILMSKDQAFVNIYRKKIESISYCMDELSKIKEHIILESSIIEEDKK